MLAISWEGRAEAFKDQAERSVKLTIWERIREACNFFVRTLRAALGQPAPQVQIARWKRDPQTGRRLKEILLHMQTGASAPGDVPFKKTGFEQSSVGAAFATGTAANDAEGTIGVAAHGWETGTAPEAPGVKRPALEPVFRDNEDIISSVLAGDTTAPRIGDLSVIAHRQPQKVRDTLERFEGGTINRTRVSYGKEARTHRVSRKQITPYARRKKA